MSQQQNTLSTSRAAATAATPTTTNSKSVLLSTTPGPKDECKDFDNGVLIHTTKPQLDRSHLHRAACVNKNYYCDCIIEDDSDVAGYKGVDDVELSNSCRLGNEVDGGDIQ